MALRWYALPAGVMAPLVDGAQAQVLCTGRSGGAAGPDICDAVLRLPAGAAWGGPPPYHQERVGDVELHVYASDWYAHGHHRDPRYNAVILHVVEVCDRDEPVRRQDGVAIPMCSLHDLSPAPSPLPLVVSPPDVPEWPCRVVMQQVSAGERARSLRLAGLLRFEQKAHTFVERLHKAQPLGAFDVYDVTLIEALAEGLGYGRNRAFFRATGHYLMGLAGAGSVPEPLGHTSAPSSLDAGRLAFLRGFVEEGRTGSKWHHCKTILRSFDCQQHVGEQHEANAHDRRGASQPYPRHDTEAAYTVRRGALHTSIEALRAMFAQLGTARADILICNVVLPFAAAVALVEQDARLWEWAQRLYEDYPALASNRITRAMRQQLRLEAEPQGACRQQGLHFIYQQTCREKRCELCMLGRRRL